MVIIGIAAIIGISIMICWGITQPENFTYDVVVNLVADMTVAILVIGIVDIRLKERDEKYKKENVLKNIYMELKKNQESIPDRLDTINLEHIKRTYTQTTVWNATCNGRGIENIMENIDLIQTLSETYDILDLIKEKEKYITYEGKKKERPDLNNLLNDIRDLYRIAQENIDEALKMEEMREYE